MNFCHEAFRNRPHCPGTSWTWSKWNSSRVQQDCSHNISETEWTRERTVVRYLRTASSAEKRSKVIGGIVSGELKKESRTIFTSEAVGYFLSGGRALSSLYTPQRHSSLWAQSSQSDKVDLWSWITRLHNRAMRCWEKWKPFRVHRLADFSLLNSWPCGGTEEKHTTFWRCSPLHFLSG